MSLEAKGAYIDALCCIADAGSISEEHMFKICNSCVEVMNEVTPKLDKTQEGCYYDQHLIEDIKKRKKYSESRRNNRLSSSTPTNETTKKEEKKVEENKNEEKEQAWEWFWETYNKKQGKRRAQTRFMRLPMSKIEKIKETLPGFLKAHSELKYRPLPSTYLNDERWEDNLFEKAEKHTTSKYVL